VGSVEASILTGSGSNEFLFVAADGYRQSPTNGPHFLMSDGTDETIQPGFSHGLNVIEVYRGIGLKSFIKSNNYFAGHAVNRGRDRRHHDRVQQVDDFGPRQHQNWSALIGTPEAVLPNLAAP